MRWIREQGQAEPYVIAEVGSSHHGRIEHALRLIDGAKYAACNAVKFQYFDAERLAARRHAEAYLDKYQQFAMPKSWLPILAARATRAGLDFIVSIYDAYGYDDVSPYTQLIKIASFEAGDAALLNEVSKTAALVIVSSGMTTHEELQDLLRWREHGANQRAVLHCISAYPCPVEELRLQTISTYSLDGFSDHSGKVSSGGLAVCYGAKMLEVHIRDTSTPSDNPDFGHALDIAGLHEYVAFAREALLAGGAARRRTVEAIEAPMSAYKVRA